MRSWRLLGLVTLLGLTPLALGDISLPVTSAKIKRYVAKNHIVKLADLLKALPLEYRQNLVLLHTSHSLMSASYSHPKQVVFGPDSKFLMGVSSVVDDPKYSTLEYAEFDENEGYYKPGEIDFASGTSPVFSDSPQSCTACHQSPWRPVWSQYSSWPDAYGDHLGEISSDDQAGFNDYLANFATSPHENPFDLEIVPGNPTFFYLKNRLWKYPNSIFTGDLGFVVAEGAFHRLHFSPSYHSLKWLLFNTMFCLNGPGIKNYLAIGETIANLYNTQLEQDPDFYAKYGKSDPIDSLDNLQIGIYRLLGIDPMSDLIFDQVGSTDDQLLYWQGSSTIAYWIEYQVLDEILQNNDEMASTLSPLVSDIHENLRKLRLSGKERANLVAKESQYNWYIYFYKNFIIPNNATSACPIIAKHAGVI